MNFYCVICENDGMTMMTAILTYLFAKEYHDSTVIIVISVTEANCTFDIITVCRYNVEKAGETK